MYIIDSYYDLPDIDYLHNRIEQLMQEGIAVKNIANLYNRLKNSENAARKNLQSLYGIDNPNSSQQVLAYFQNIINDDIVEACCRNGKWTTNKEAMQELAMKGYQEAIDILTYRKASAYVRAIEQIKEHIKSDGRLRPKVSYSKTNRINYIEPALMNIPKQLIWHIIAPRTEGNILISVDIKNQEPWIMINMLNIKMLKEILENNSEGLYEAVFEKIFGRPCTPIERNELKVAWNAMTYGATLMGVQAICRHCDGKAIYEFFSKIPEFKQYRGICYGRAKKNKQEVETYFGTKVRANEYGPRLQRVLMDIPIQGTGVDILALLIKHFDEEMETRGLEDVITLVFTRHDEIIVEVDRNYANEVGIENVKAILADVLEHKIDDWEPFNVKITEVVPPELFIDGSVYNPDDDED
jgi:DNA polymerase I-like protein with 3'-5' exonuclease and polymerase domains